MVKAVFLDFYGTVVHEDGVVINEVSERIYQTGNANNKSQIGAFWWNEFQNMFTNSYGQSFRSQRELEYQSLVNTIQHFQSTENANEISNYMFEQWVKPPIFEEAKEFFNQCPVPIYIVSNIDIADINQAIEFHDLKPAGVFTSEAARSYKPRKELFELALKETGLMPNEVVHIGDSLNSDIKGASALGINAIWINRFGKVVPENIMSVTDLLQGLKTVYFK
ncbi:MAG: HAD family hydrolase [Mobilitalea sp.]